MPTQHQSRPATKHIIPLTGCPHEPKPSGEHTAVGRCRVSYAPPSIHHTLSFHSVEVACSWWFGVQESRRVYLTTRLGIVWSLRTKRIRRSSLASGSYNLFDHTPHTHILRVFRALVCGNRLGLLWFLCSDSRLQLDVRIPFAA